MALCIYLDVQAPQNLAGDHFQSTDAVITKEYCFRGSSIFAKCSSSGAYVPFHFRGNVSRSVNSGPQINRHTVQYILRGDLRTSICLFIARSLATQSSWVLLGPTNLPGHQMLEELRARLLAAERRMWAAEEVEPGTANTGRMSTLERQVQKN